MTATDAPKKPAFGHLNGIQAGRGIAALSVVMTHAVAHPYGGAPPAWHMLGRYGVTLFFVISGFIMVHTTGTSQFDPGKFIVHRLKRIVPIYYIANLVLLVSLAVAPGAFKRTAFSIPYFIRSLLFIPTYEPSGTGFIWPFFRLGWTLNYEMFFYISFAALFALNMRGRAMVLTLWFGALIALGIFHPFADAIPRFYTQIDTLGFVAGVWLGVLELNGRLVGSRWFQAAALLASLAGYIAITLDYIKIKDDPWTQVATVAICTLNVALLVMMVDHARRAVPRLLLASGDASYAIYLFHMFAIGTVTALGHRMPPVMLYPMIIVAALSAAALGMSVYRFVERPVNRLLRRHPG
ncbi:acyltransferase family protein [Novosphingobium sp.]|uniref:acyltransferase family protein n=1 Tax=Novosphingobium sp. TaxID=1874826 RepID=UPI003D0C38E8